MDEKEWEDSDSDYRCEALRALRSLIALEDVERVARQLEKAPWRFFKKQRDRSSQDIDWPMGMMINHASRDFCQDVARLASLDEGGWSRLERGLLLIAKEGVSGWKVGRNWDALLEGFSRNVSAPSNFSQRLGVGMIDLDCCKGSGGSSGWGASGPASVAAWGQAWLAWAHGLGAARQARGAPSALMEEGVNAMGSHWRHIIRNAGMGRHGMSAADSVACLELMEELLDRALEEALAPAACLEKGRAIAAQGVRDALGFGAGSPTEEAEGLRGASSKTLALAAEALGPHASAKSVALLEVLTLRRQAFEQEGAGGQAPSRRPMSL
jgi:hypothetical protein